MPSFAPELLIVLFLIVLNGAFAMSEMAIVSARKARLEQRAAAGDSRARLALDLANDPNALLSTIQVGITLIGIINGAYGGATIAQVVSDAIQVVPVLAPYSGPIGFGLVVSAITYLSLVVGELVPKRLALSNPERIAIIAAVPMQALATVARPIVRLLSASNDLVLRLLGSGPSDDAPVTEDEIKILIQQGTQAGVFQAAEQELVERVFKLGDAHVDELMTPRHEVVWLDVEDAPAELRRVIVEGGHSRLPVGRGSLDDVLGVVKTQAILAKDWSGQPVDVASLAEPAVFVPETMDVYQVLDAFRQAETELAVVVDEYGGTQGIITVADVLKAIVGGLPADGDAASPPIVRLEDGSWSVDGQIPIDELEDALGVRSLAPEDRGSYRSLGGFMMTRIGRLPAIGDRVEWADHHFEILDMDGRRVDRVLVRPVRFRLGWRGAGQRGGIAAPHPPPPSPVHGRGGRGVRGILHLSPDETTVTLRWGWRTTMLEPRIRAVEAYVQAIRTGAPSAAERAAEHLAESVVLAAGPQEFSGRAAVLRQITGQWPWTATYVGASWSDPTPDGDRLTVHGEFPPMGASPAAVDLAFSFDAEGRIARVEQVTTTPPPLPVSDTIPGFVRGIVNGALANGTPLVLTYVDEDGRPSMSLRGSVQVYSDTQLSMWVRNANGGLIRSLKKNPAVSLLYRESKLRTTLIFRGTGRVEHDEAVRERVFTQSPEVEQLHDLDRKGAVVLVDVTSIQGTSTRGAVRMERQG